MSTTDRESPAGTGTRAHLHEVLPEGRQALWMKGFGRWEQPVFPRLVGLEIEEIRQDYARMRLPYRPELNQPAGVPSTRDRVLERLTETEGSRTKRHLATTSVVYPDLPVALEAEVRPYGSP